MKQIILFTFIIALSSCASVEYVSPDLSGLGDEQYNKEVAKNFDDTWSTLIRFAGSTFYGIDNFEKSSGLMTLSFSVSNMNEYVTGGHFQASSIAENFEGEYVDFLQYHRNGILTGRINLVIESISEELTLITVNTRYVVEVSEGATSLIRNLRWSFDTNGYDVRSHGTGSNPERVIRPTHSIERHILSAFE